MQRVPHTHTHTFACSVSFHMLPNHPGFPAMETPATIRRNPPRKAKLSSAEKSTVKEYRSSRKRYVAEGKALMPSFAAAEEKSSSSLKHTEEATPQPENLKLDSALQQSFDYTKDAGICDSQQKNSVNHMHACVTESFVHENSAQQSVANPMNVVELEKSKSIIAVEKDTATSKVGFEAENPQSEAPLARSTTKQASGRVRVFLRIRPARVARAGKLTGKALKSANISVQHRKRPREETTSYASDVCLWSQTSDCVTLVTPATFLGSHKPKAEEFNGFSHIFNPDSAQKDVFNEILAPRLVDLINGKSSVVVAMGPTSAGKTHTMLGTPGDPGLLPQSLQYLFGANLSESASSTMRVVLSMFEIYSEQGGRFEKILDLLQDGSELSLQQSKIKGLHEVIASTVEEANAILLNGLQKRTTASTAANHRSSRSHCIINISTCQVKHLKSVDALISSKWGTLTVVDLAGFEREKKTKNQGARLNESGFINNTSMVFGQCLRALLEHQKNPKKTLQRHFQYSMLTRYLKPYMEANGDMTLIVNVSPCEEDYLDTAFVLRQAAPYSSIKLNLPPPTKDNVENLTVEKRILPWKERQPPMKRQRKLDGATNASVNVLNCSNITKSKIREEVLNTMPDPGDEFKGLEEELYKCQAEAVGGIVGETRKNSGKTNQIILATNPTDDLTATFLAAVNNVLVREGVKNADRVSLSVMKIFDTALKQYHFLQDIEEKLQQQHAEMTLLSTNLIKEQKNAFALSSELETLKKYCESLENQLLSLEKSSLSHDVDHLRPLVSTKIHSPSERNIQNISGSQTSRMECTVNDRDVGVPILVACSSSILTKNLCDIDGDGSPVCSVFKAHNNLDGQIKANARSINNPSIRFSTVLPSMDENCEEATLIKADAQSIDDPSVIFSTMLPSMDNNHEEVRELDDLNLGETVAAVNECTQLQFSDTCANNTLVTLGTCNGQDTELQVCDSEGDLDLDSSIMPLSETVQCSNMGLFLSSQNRATEGHMACQVALEVDEYHNQQRADYESSQILQVNSLFPRNSEVREVADKDQVKLMEKEKKCTSASVTMLDRDCNLHSSDHETCQSEEYLKLEQGKKPPSPYVQKLFSSQGQITSSTAVEKAGSPQSYKDRKVSNLQKGRMLAFSLMQESKLPYEIQSDYDLQSVQPSNTDISIGTIGPIGHDLEELLKIPLSDIEKELSSPEAATCSGQSDFHSKCNGLLDFNKLPQKYSQQRANCIRYCLAVICGKMSVDGKCVPLAKETKAPRKRHFYAVIQARTVTEAAGHARAGFQLEALSIDNKTEIQRVDKAGAAGKASAQSGSSVETQDNKENRNCSPVSSKANGPPKRRRLQPISTLSLQADRHICPDFEFIDASAEEVYPPKSTVEGRTSKANSLAYLLSHHNR